MQRREGYGTEYVGGGGGRMVDGFVTHAPHRGNATVLSANNLSHSERVREGVIKYNTQSPEDPGPFFLPSYHDSGLQGPRILLQAFDAALLGA